jgi:hypothetical protein
MKTIYKFPVGPIMELVLPEDAEPLCVQLQNGEPQLWVLLDTDNPPDQRTFVTFGTGHEAKSHNSGTLKYISTWQREGLVFHTFESVWH